MFVILTPGARHTSSPAPGLVTGSWDTEFVQFGAHQPQS